MASIGILLYLDTTMIPEPKLPIFARTRSAIGFIIAAFLSIYKPKLSYQFIHDALEGQRIREKKHEIDSQKLPISLNVYSQEKWNDPVFICGTPAALELLRESIVRALNEDNHSEQSFHTSDGESYLLTVIATQQPERFAVPYTSDIASEERLKAYHPAREMT